MVDLFWTRSEQIHAYVLHLEEMKICSDSPILFQDLGTGQIQWFSLIIFH